MSFSQSPCSASSTASASSCPTLLSHLYLMVLEEVAGLALAFGVVGLGGVDAEPGFLHASSAVVAVAAHVLPSPPTYPSVVLPVLVRAKRHLSALPFNHLCIFLFGIGGCFTGVFFHAKEIYSFHSFLTHAASSASFRGRAEQRHLAQYPEVRFEAGTFLRLRGRKRDGSFAGERRGERGGVAGCGGRTQSGVGRIEGGLRAGKEVP